MNSGSFDVAERTFGWRQSTDPRFRTPLITDISHDAFL